MRNKSSLWFVILLSAGFGSGCKKKTEDKAPQVILKAPVKMDINTVKDTRAGQRLLPKLQLSKAEGLLFAKKYEEALGVYDELSKLSGLTAEARSQLFAGMAESYLGLKRYEESVVAWEKVMAIRSADPSPVHNIATVYMAAEKYLKAQEYLQKTIKLDPFKLDAHLDLLQVMHKLSVPEKEIVKIATSLATHRNKMVEFLGKIDGTADIYTIVKYLDYLSAMPEKDDAGKVSLKFMEKALAHRSVVIRTKAGDLAVRTEEGAKKVLELLKTEKDLAVKKAWTTSLRRMGHQVP
ncbi:hypothetical protein KKF84_17840 [Myxococcota bacterium]|nr:hypothetical protein [Myxococcota bacterium]MBU1537183.1 hypothetical protein [Myxococcota bacterium]